ncbi:CaiB/BaiF CoA transferase family protein [Chloroflexota bacterium]
MVDALAGIRVTDFGHVLAGAIPGQLMADMGAEVIKVETRARLDYMRRGRPIIGDKPDPEQNPMFHNVNHSKLSISVDMVQPKANRLLKELIKISDVVIENFSPAVMGSIGLDYPDLVQVKPDIIMLSMPGAGRHGPRRNVRTVAPTVNSLSGIDYLTGYTGEQPLGIKLIYGDMCSALHGLFALLTALHYRRKTGKGQHIDLSMCESITVLMGEAIMDYTMNNRVLSAQGNRHPTMAPHNLYRCQGEDKWVAIAVDTEEEWKSFCQAVGNPEWVNEVRFSDKFKRMNNLDALDKHITEWTVNYTPYEVMDILQKAGVAATPHMSAADRFYDPHYQEHKVYVDVEHPILGSEVIYNQVWKMSETPGRIRRRAPLMGEHNNYVFGELLHLPSEEIEQLVEEKVIY